ADEIGESLSDLAVEGPLPVVAVFPQVEQVDEGELGRHRLDAVGGDGGRVEHALPEERHAFLLTAELAAGEDLRLDGAVAARLQGVAEALEALLPDVALVVGVGDPEL